MQLYRSHFTGTVLYHYLDLFIGVTSYEVIIVRTYFHSAVQSPSVYRKRKKKQEREKGKGKQERKKGKEKFMIVLVVQINEFSASYYEGENFLSLTVWVYRRNLKVLILFFILPLKLVNKTGWPRLSVLSFHVLVLRDVGYCHEKRRSKIF